MSDLLNDLFGGVSEIVDSISKSFAGDPAEEPAEKPTPPAKQAAPKAKPPKATVPEDEPAADEGSDDDTPSQFLDPFADDEADAADALDDDDDEPAPVRKPRPKPKAAADDTDDDEPASDEATGGSFFDTVRQGFNDAVDTVVETVKGFTGSTAVDEPEEEPIGQAAFVVQPGDEDKVLGSDLDGDGTPDNVDFDVDEDGLADDVDPDDDNDGIADAKDIDDDGDGFTDEDESAVLEKKIDDDGRASRIDADRDGLDDVTEDTDDDNDGIKDKKDFDRDNDGFEELADAKRVGKTTAEGTKKGPRDATEVAESGKDRGGRARMSLLSDLDRDGVADRTDADIDGDGIKNSADLDDDNDGSLDLFDKDDDGDGFLDITEQQAFDQARVKSFTESTVEDRAGGFEIPPDGLDGFVTVTTDDPATPAPEPTGFLGRLRARANDLLEDVENSIGRAGVAVTGDDDFGTGTKGVNTVFQGDRIGNAFRDARSSDVDRVTLGDRDEDGIVDEDDDDIDDDGAPNFRDIDDDNDGVADVDDFDVDGDGFQDISEINVRADAGAD